MLPAAVTTSVAGFSLPPPAVTAAVHGCGARLAACAAQPVVPSPSPTGSGQCYSNVLASCKSAPSATSDVAVGLVTRRGERGGGREREGGRVDGWVEGREGERERERERNREERNRERERLR